MDSTTSRPNSTMTVSKVTKSHSLSSRPAGFHPPAGSRISGSGPRSVSKMSGVSSSASRPKGGSRTKAGVVVETMSAPNPFCPNTRGVCCLMILVNLGLILVAIGFIIVLQLPDPAFVWNIGIVILVFGFVTFFISLVYCIYICQEGAEVQKSRNMNNGELYWTHHWQKNITIPDIKSSDTLRWEEQDQFPEDDVYSNSSSPDYPRLYIESDYGQRVTDREADFEETEQEGDHHQHDHHHHHYHGREKK